MKRIIFAVLALTATIASAAGPVFWAGGPSGNIPFPLMIDGSTDAVQLLVQQNGTQTAFPIVLEGSTGTDSFAVQNGGGVLIGDIANGITTQGLGLFGGSGALTDITQRKQGSSATAFPTHSLQFTRGSLASPTIVNNGDGVGQIEFRAWDGGAYREVAQITGFVDGTPGSGDMPGGIVFDATPDGTSTAVRQWYMRQNGNFLMYGSTVAAPSLQWGEDADNGTNTVSVKALDNLAGDYTLTWPPDDGDSGEVLSTDGSGVLDWVAAATLPIDLATDVTGVLPLANGGTNKNATAVNGGLVWSDSDSLEITSAGTAGQWVLSGGAGTPTMSNTTTTAKVVDVATDSTPMTLTGHSTQTSDLFVVEADGGADSLVVNGDDETSGANVVIRGTATNDAAASGFVGEYIQGQTIRSAAVSLTTATTANIASISLGAGDWDIGGSVGFDSNASTSLAAQNGAISLTSATLPNTDTLAVPTSGEYRARRMQTTVTGTTEFVIAIPDYRISLATTTTVYLVAQATFTISTVNAYGAIWARRVR